MKDSPQVFLSYSKSIFQDDSSLLILAWLERTGETRESEIASSIGKEEHEIKRSLVGLHQNRFVTYKENTVRITEAGKEILDRLGIAEKIIESALEFLNVPSRYRNGLWHLLSQYRDSAYNYYLDTQASVKCYNNFHHVCHFSISETKASKDFQNIANLAIIFRDLKNWMRHSTEGLSSRLSLHHSSGEVKQLKFLGESPWELPAQTSSSVRRSLDLLSWCDDYDRSINQTAREIEKSSRISFDKIFLIFEDFQRRNKREEWFDRWNNAVANIELAQKSPRLADFYLYFINSAAPLPEEAAHKSKGWADWWDKMPPNYFKPMIVDHSSVALGHILTSKSLKEFCSHTELDQEASILLLRRIGSKIHKLLNEEQTD